MVRFFIFFIITFYACKPPQSGSSERASYNYQKVPVTSQEQNPNEVSSLNTLIAASESSSEENSSDEPSNAGSPSSDPAPDIASVSPQDSNSEEAPTISPASTRTDRHYRIIVETGEDSTGHNAESAGTVNSLKIELTFENNVKKEFVLQNTKYKTNDTRPLFYDEEQKDYFDFPYEDNNGNLLSFRIALSLDNQSIDPWIGKKITVSDGVFLWEMSEQEEIGEITTDSYDSSRDFLFSEAVEMSYKTDETYIVYLNLHSEHEKMIDRIQVKLKGKNSQGTDVSSRYSTLNEYDYQNFQLNKGTPNLLYSLPVKMNNVENLDKIYIRLQCNQSASYTYDQLIFKKISVSDSVNKYSIKYNSSNRFVIGSDPNNASWAYECSFYGNSLGEDPICKQAVDERCE